MKMTKTKKAGIILACYDTIDMLQKKEEKRPQICYDVNNDKNT